jgi:glycosyl transferase, family 25|tara:strand:- start:141 stop:755 length:615 start_codon:yes stop_codon:yes gene_type:complete
MSKNIEHIFYINLDKRKDRKSQLEQEMKKVGWNAERYSGIYSSPPRGIVGCGKSHLNVLKIAKDRLYKNVLILEDDFTFIESKEVIEQELQQLFDLRPDFDVCFLSYNLKKGKIEADFPFLTRVFNSSTASAYIVKNHYYDKLIKIYEDAIPKLEATMEHWNYANDQVWVSLQEKDHWYCFTKRLGKQRDGYSDNADKNVIYNC